MSVTLKTFAPARVAYLRHVGPYPKLGEFWMQVAGPWLMQNNLGNVPRYGVSWSDPMNTPPEQCMYDAAAEVPADLAAPEGAKIATLPGGLYAVCEFKGLPGPVIGGTFEKIANWIAQSEYTFDARPPFEYYPINNYFNPQTGEYGCEVCIAVVKK